MKTVLVVEDMKDYSDCLELILSQKGYKVVTAANGAEGLEKAKSVKPDLILMDIFMPDQDGGETVLKIKSDSSLRNIPIIFLTALASGSGSDSDPIVVDGQEYPAISKMADKEEIIKKVGEYLHS
ncbi:MAG: response regulator [Candidatus Omnitrophica bacterium]|nr:response regulator [Candidatus Omnitrophota bacterium]